MKVFKLTKISLMLGFLLALTASCGSTKMLSSWSIENPPENVMDKVLVLAVMQNMEQKDGIENGMVAELNKAGVNAHTATDVFGPKGFQGLTQEQVTEKLRGSNFTSVMIVSLVDKEKYKTYVPGTFYSTPRVVGYSRYYRRYLVVYDDMYTPGYYNTGTNYVLEADIYTVNDDDRLIFSAQTESYDPSSTKAMASSFARTIVESLKAKSIIR